MTLKSSSEVWLCIACSSIHHTPTPTCRACGAPTALAIERAYTHMQFKGTTYDLLFTYQLVLPGIDPTTPEDT